MKLINLLPLSLIGTTVIMPLAISTNSNKIEIKANSKTEQETEERYRCTITYVGKECTKDGLPIIARTADGGQALSQSHLMKFKHNELANKTITNLLGYSYTLPSETFAYACAPDCAKTSQKDSVAVYQNFAFNEKGVGLSCTLSCFANESTVLTKDPFIKNGIVEEVLNQSIIPQAKSARHCMELAAQLIDSFGSGEGNIIMAVDQQEAWLMEMYTGHQYCAIKLPTDKMCVVGNEFFLNTLDELGINAINECENCIHSADLWNFAHANGYDQYSQGTVEANKDIYHLHLFNTYARPLTDASTDYSHMRTWRGYSLFQPNSTIAQKYEQTEKYAPFFVPNRKDLSVYDVANIYRDEYDNILTNSSRTDYSIFKTEKDEGSLRSIATDKVMTIHIMTSDPARDAKFAVNCWYCPSSSNYTPFTLLNNGMDLYDDEFTYIPERYGFDSNCASTIYRRLNALGAIDRENYGLPLQPLCQQIEKIYGVQMNQVINDAIKLNEQEAKTIISNFGKHIRNVEIEAVRFATNDLMSHIMSDKHVSENCHTLYTPMIDFVTYLTDLGWTNFKKSGNEYTFQYGNNIQGKLNIGDGYYKEQGSITISNTTQEIPVKYENSKVYVDFNKLNTLIASYSAIKTINIYDYLPTSVDKWVWLAPTIVASVATAGAIVFFIIRKKKLSKNLNK